VTTHAAFGKADGHSAKGLFVVSTMELPPYAMIRLPELGPEQVPAGTEVWTI
jgi:hypothetical protein